MPTANQLGFSLDDNYVLNSLKLEDKSSIPYDITQGRYVLDYLLTKNTPPRRTDGDKGKFKTPVIGTPSVVAEISSTALVGTNLKINFTDTTYDKFRNKAIVSDGVITNFKGRVVDHQPGYIVVEPAENITTLATATHFVAGRFCSEVGQADTIRGSHTMESLYETPVYVENQCSVYREGWAVDRADMSQTWATYKGKYWVAYQERAMFERIGRGKENTALWGRYGTQNLSGEVNYSRGLLETIQDPTLGGNYVPMLSKPTLEDLNLFLGKTAINTNSATWKPTLLTGSGGLKVLQDMFGTYIQYTGTMNTLGGEKVVGLDAYEWGINGVRAQIIKVPSLDTDLFPGVSTISGMGHYQASSYYMFLIDLGTYTSKDGQSLPAAEKVYFGDKPECYDALPGITFGGSYNGTNSASVGAQMRPGLVVSDTPSIGYTYYSYDCLNFVAKNCGVMFPAV